MAQKETVRTYHWNDKAQLEVRIVGLIIPAVLIGYGAAVRFGLLDTWHSATNSIIGNWDFYIISFLLLCLAAWQFVFPVGQNKKRITIEVISYHLLFSLFFIFIAGIVTPLLFVWAQISVLASVYFLDRGLRLSILTLALTIFTNVLIWQPFSTPYLIYGIVALIVIYYIVSFFMAQSKTNVVERKELHTAKTEEALQRERIVTIINNLADAIISTDTEGIIRVSNAASMSLLNTNTTLIGKQIDNVLPVVDLAGKKVSIFDELHSAKTAKRRDDLIYSFSEEDKMRLEIIFSPVRRNYDEHSKKDVNLDGYVAILRDVTKAKSLEEERDEFISVTSHELRTPITVAEGALSNVKAAMTNPDAPKKVVEDAVDTAYDQITFLANMVNDLNALSRAESGQGKAQTIDVGELAKRLVKQYTDDANIKKLSFDLTISPEIGKIKINQSYLEEILQNLISNAIKYTQKGSVKLKIQKRGNGIRFMVTDTGIGISSSDQKKLFSKFYRSEDYRTRETGGTGMGLYIAAKLADKINTRIQFTSTLNEGSSFWFDIKTKK